MDTSLTKIKNTPLARNIYKVWFDQAQHDMQAALLSMENSFFEWATYQAEQAVEKALKSVIAHAGMHPPRVHKLPILIGICNHLNKQFQNTKLDFRHLESFTFISRYPFLLPGRDVAPHELISKHDADKAVRQGRTILNQIADILKHPVTEMHVDLTIKDTYSEKEIDQRLEQIQVALVKEFKPQKIVLFGSFARDKKRAKDKTMDILLIADSPLSFIERIQKAREVTSGGDPVIEPLVYTPEEFRIMYDQQGEGFLESALAEGITLYENKVKTD